MCLSSCGTVPALTFREAANPFSIVDMPPLTQGQAIGKLLVALGVVVYVVHEHVKNSATMSTDVESEHLTVQGINTRLLTVNNSPESELRRMARRVAPAASAAWAELPHYCCCLTGLVQAKAPPWCCCMGRPSKHPTG